MIKAVEPSATRASLGIILKGYPMGRLTAELPGGLIHSWIGKDKATVDDFLRRFRHRLEEHVRHDAEVQQAAQGQPPDAVLRRWVYGMLRHVLATPSPTLKSAFDFRRMFVTYVLLIREVEVPSTPAVTVIICRITTSNSNWLCSTARWRTSPRSR